MMFATNMVHGYLLKNAVGKQNAVTLKKMAVDLGLPKRTVERATEEIREHQLAPLCSETRVDHIHGIHPGHFIAVNVTELNPYYRQIESRIKKLCIHRAQLRQLSIKLWGQKPSKQLSLFGEAA